MLAGAVVSGAAPVAFDARLEYPEQFGTSSHVLMMK
jgi:hypothetical protein